MCLHSIQPALPTSATPLFPGVYTVARQIYESALYPCPAPLISNYSPGSHISFLHSQSDVICQTVYVRSPQ